MNIETGRKQPRSRRNGVLQCHRWQLTLCSTLLLNLAMAFSGATARSAVSSPTEPAEPAPETTTPLISLDHPILETPSAPSLPVDPGAIAQSHSTNPDQASQELAPTPAPDTSVVVDPISQNVSKQASDLFGASTQPLAQTTLAQTENPTPTDNPPDAQDPTINNPLIPPPGWRFDFEPYIFFPFDVDGKIFFGRGRNLLFPNRPGVVEPTSGINLDVSTNFSDITAKLTNLFGALGRFQVWNGKVGVVAEGVYVNSDLSSGSSGGTLTLRDRFDIPVPGFQIDARNTLSSFSLGASYQLGPQPLRTITNPADPSNYYPALSFEVLAGVRYLSVFQSIEFERGPDFEFSGSEFNPMLGGTARLLLSDRFAFFFRGDTANLGGGNLKQYYNLYAGLDWKFSGSFALRLAYRLNQIEFIKKGPFGGENGLNLRSQGVQLGVSWQF